MSCRLWKSCSNFSRFQMPSKYQTNITVCVKDITKDSEISFSSFASKIKNLNVDSIEISRQQTTNVLWMVVIAIFAYGDGDCHFKYPISLQYSFASLNSFILNWIFFRYLNFLSTLNLSMSSIKVSLVDLALCIGIGLRRIIINVKRV